MRVVTSLVVAVLLFVSFVTFAGDEKTNFSGQWSINNEKSQLTESTQGKEGMLRRAMVAKSLIVTQEGNNLSVERVLEGQDGNDFKVPEKFILDGKASETVMSGRSRKSVANWSEDGKSLTISLTNVFERDGNKMEITHVETWKLTEDGNSLSIDSIFRIPSGEIKNTYIYDRVK